ncbi:GNAT family N-acetyltransferase [Trinickia fusca]|uniref:N-acetyltransferase n=1 Tax=Trinickia fusca TaxID=2419777 RepID=A0A494XU30_9BURK|nr:GNAT family protein [Trinickia fusca]RKP52456.1 N-acetyltransferase [Trinickia fusca]
MTFARPESLAGPSVFLEPLSEEHREPLRKASKDDEAIWTYFPRTFNGAGEDFDPWFDYTLSRDAERTHYPFAVKRQSDREVIGTTRFYDMSYDHRRLAIGSTWYCREARGTLINAEVRLLTLAYAFERFEVNRVELITDPRNLNSRAAMRILGAVQEGIIRNHLIYKDGRIRDSILYSIVRNEWPAVRERLFEKLGYAPAQLRY